MKTFSINHPVLGVVEVEEVEGMSSIGLLTTIQGRTIINVSAELSAESQEAVCQDLIKQRVQCFDADWPEFLD